MKNDEIGCHPRITILALAPCQQTAWWWQHFGPGGVWEYVLLEKYGPWRPARPGEKGIPCEVEMWVPAQ